MFVVLVVPKTELTFKNRASYI